MPDKDVAEIRRNFYRQQGVFAERERVLELIKSFYCGDPNCNNHPADMPALIRAIGEVKGNLSA